LAPTHAFKVVPSGLGCEEFAPQPDDAALHHAAEVLNVGEKVAILIGQGAADGANVMRTRSGRAERGMHCIALPGTTLQMPRSSDQQGRDRLRAFKNSTRRGPPCRTRWEQSTALRMRADLLTTA
jgi:hypothetical protein